MADDEIPERLDELRSTLCHQCADVLEEILNLDNKYCEICHTYRECVHKE